MDEIKEEIKNEAVEEKNDKDLTEDETLLLETKKDEENKEK